MEEIIEYSPENQFCGIIHNILTEKSGSVLVEASDTYSDFYPEYLIEQEDRLTHWETSSRKPNPWVKFEFVDYKVKLSGYVLQSTEIATDDLDPNSWIVVGSNDGEEWFILDDQEDTRALSGPKVTEYFHCSEKESEEAFKYIKIQMVEPNYHGDWTFRLAQVEFFGTIEKE